MALLRNCVNVAQPPFERIFFECGVEADRIADHVAHVARGLYGVVRGQRDLGALFQGHLAVPFDSVPGLVGSVVLQQAGRPPARFAQASSDWTTLFSRIGLLAPRDTLVAGRLGNPSITPRALTTRPAI